MYTRVKYFLEEGSWHRSGSRRDCVLYHDPPGNRRISRAACRIPATCPSGRGAYGRTEHVISGAPVIEPGMRLAGCPLRETALPAECLVVSIRRQGELLFPRGSTVIEAGDQVTFLVNSRGEERMKQYLAEREHAAEPSIDASASRR